MPFIGIIGKETDSNFIKNEVLKNSINTKFEILNITQSNIQNMKNIKFETLVIDNNLEEFLKTSKCLEKIIKECKYIIVNSDIIKNVQLFAEFDNVELITYGLNRDAVVTTSSIKDDNILICIQKSIKGIDEKVIEEQEFNIEILKNNLKKICNSMVIFTILAIYGGKLKKI